MRSNVDDTLTVDFYTLNTGDGTLSGLTTPVSIDLLSSSYVTEQVGIETSGSSPDFTREEFLAHAQVRVIDTMNDYVIDGTGDLGVNGSLFTRSSGGQMNTIYEKTDVVTFDYASSSPSSTATLWPILTMIKPQVSQFTTIKRLYPLASRLSTTRPIIC